MKTIDSRMTYPAFYTYDFEKTCTIIHPDGTEHLAYMPRSRDEKGKITGFEAAYVYPAVFKGEEVLVQYYQLKERIRYFHINTDGKYVSDEDEGIVYEAYPTPDDKRPVYTYMLPAFPDEKLAKLSEETRKDMVKIEKMCVKKHLMGKIFSPKKQPVLG